MGIGFFACQPGDRCTTAPTGAGRRFLFPDFESA